MIVASRSEVNGYTKGFELESLPLHIFYCCFANCLTILKRLQATYGTISTNSTEMEGYPAGSFISYAADTEGRPIVAVSSLSSHTVDLKKDGRY